MIKATARLVDVGFVAYDKHGKPVTDLKQDEIAVFDNGVQQQVRALLPGRSGNPIRSGSGGSRAYHSRHIFQPAGRGFGHRRQPNYPFGNGAAYRCRAFAVAGPAIRTRRNYQIPQQACSGATGGALYTMDDIGFHVLAEMTQDHALLAAKLKAWTPSAGTAALAQEAQDRNTRHIDEVQNPTDLQTVNGNLNAAADDEASMPLDIQLRDLGANPGRESLRVLIAIARHLAPVPGHKSLIWVSGDAAMADFGDQVSVTGPQKNKKEYLNEIANSAGRGPQPGARRTLCARCLVDRSWWRRCQPVATWPSAR